MFEDPKLPVPLSVFIHYSYILVYYSYNPMMQVVTMLLYPVNILAAAVKNAAIIIRVSWLPVWAGRVAL